MRKPTYYSKKPNNKIWAVPVAIAALLGTFALGYLSGQRQPPVAKDFCVGVVLPQTGDSGYIGQLIKNGMEVARAEYLKGQTEKDFDLRVEYVDTGGDPARVVTAYQSLVNVRDCQSIVAVQQGIKALIQRAERDRRVLLATSAPDNGITNQNPWVFRFFINAEKDAKTMAEYAFRRLKLRRAALIYVNNSTGISYRDSFTQNFTALGGEVIENQTFNAGSTDYRAQILRIKQAQPDAVYIIGYDQSIAQIPIQLREAGVNATLLSVGTISQPEILQAAGKAANGIYYTTAEFATELGSGSPQLKEFVTEYQKQHGSAPVFFEFFGYDSLRLLLLAAQRGGIESEQVREALSQINDVPLAVGTVSVERDGNVNFSMVVRKIVDGKWAPAP